MHELDHLGFDVGFTNIHPDKRAWGPGGRFIKGRLKKRDFMQFKYVLVLQGNDVATSLKWLMKRNSVAVMAPPTREGWLMEGLLEPYVHYVPAHKPSEMPAVLEWLKSHDDECRNIVRNANDWVDTVTHGRPRGGKTPHKALPVASQTNDVGVYDPWRSMLTAPYARELLLTGAFNQTFLGV